MITVKCDRCGTDMDPQGYVGHLGWCLQTGLGDPKKNELKGQIYCERCMDEIMTTIQSRANWQKTEKIRYEKPEVIPEPPKKEYITPVIEEVKRKGRKSEISGKGEQIWKLKADGLTNKEIAEEMGLDPVQVKNWLYYHKEKE